jgi:hypothetical protein
VQLVEQRLQVARQHAAFVETFDQLMHRQQRVDLSLGKPQAGQFVLHLPSVARIGHGEPVAIAVAVIDDGRIEPLAQVLEVALQRGAADAELVHQVGEGHAAAVADQQFDFVEALSSIHTSGSWGEPPW